MQIISAFTMIKSISYVWVFHFLLQLLIPVLSFLFWYLHSLLTSSHSHILLLFSSWLPCKSLSSTRAGISQTHRTFLSRQSSLCLHQFLISSQKHTLPSTSMVFCNQLQHYKMCSNTFCILPIQCNICALEGALLSDSTVKHAQFTGNGGSPYAPSNSKLTPEL